MGSLVSGYLHGRFNYTREEDQHESYVERENQLDRTGTSFSNVEQATKALEEPVGMLDGSLTTVITTTALIKKKTFTITNATCTTSGSTVAIAPGP